MRGLHQEKSLENLKQLSGKYPPSRTQVFFFFSGLVNVNEAAVVSMIVPAQHTSDCCYIY